MKQKLAILSVPHAINEDDILCGIPIVPVVRRELVMPFAFAGVGINRNDGIAEEVIPVATNRPVDLRAGIADGPVECVQIRVEGAGKPHRAAAELPAVAFPRIVSELTRRGHGIKPPHLLSGCSVVCIEKTAWPKLSTGDADD